MAKTTKSEPVRCGWAQGELLQPYHDREWGRPAHADDVLFEMLTLEGAQAGLSWETVLRKRERYRKLFHGFDVERVARITKPGVERILTDPGIIRNRAKVESTVSNARAFLAVRDETGSFDRFIWSFVDGKPIDNRLQSWDQIQATTERSETMSKELRKRGFRFVGPTICYSFMQAVGMVNDHLVSCAWHDKVATAKRRSK